MSVSTKISSVCGLRIGGFLSISFLALAFLLGFPESAEPDERKLVPPDPWQMIHMAREFGPAEVSHDAMKDPLIVGKIDGLIYEIAFYGCWLGRECESVLFLARLERKDWTPEAELLKDWNSEKLIGRAWLEGKGTAMLDYPVAMAAGLPEETLSAAFEAWQTALVEYAEHLDF